MAAFFGFLVLIGFVWMSNGNFVENSMFECNGDVFWEFKSSTNITHDMSELNGSRNIKDNYCQNKCELNDDCDAWGIDINNNDVCYSFTFIEGPLIYYCYKNDMTTHYGQIRQCLTDKRVISSNNIIVRNKDVHDSIFIYDRQTGCLSKHILKDEHLNKRRLNIVPFPRVMTNPGPMTPNKYSKHELKPNVDYEPNKFVLCIDKECCERNDVAGNKNCKELIKDILRIQDGCLTQINTDKGDDGDGIYQSKRDFITFAILVGSETCLSDKIIDFQGYCISNFFHSRLATVDGNAQCLNNLNTGWNLGAMLNNKYFSNIDNSDELNFYILDSEVNINHPEFSHISRKSILGGAFLGGDHGTHVTSIIVGNTIGVFRDPNIGLYTWGACGVRFCSESDIFNGLIAVRNHMRNSGKKGIINMSLGGYCGFICNQYDSYFADIKALGGIIVVSAGNSNDNACFYHPAGEPDAISVGNYDIFWRREFRSNYGDCVDTWGPGTAIRAAWYNGYGTFTGTSMSSPAVAGIVGALMLTQERFTYDSIKKVLQCPNDRCHYMRSVTDSRSQNQFGFSHDCDNVDSLFNFGTLSPTLNTIEPTNLPTMEPTLGTIIPTDAPTVPTFSPTIEPTMRPTSFIRELRQRVIIFGSSGPRSTTVCFNINRCRRPSITLDYLPIDYDRGSTEDITISYGFQSFTCARFLGFIDCINRRQCGPYLLANSWNINSNKCVTIRVGSAVNDLCGSSLGLLNADAILTCEGTDEPTIEPTTQPTVEPTVPSVSPTNSPTLSPVFSYSVSEFVNISRSRGPANATVCFDIDRCMDPSISAEYLPIDYDDSNEYLRFIYQPNGASFTCAQFVQVNCRSTNTCGPFALGSDLDLNDNKCITVSVGPWVDSLCGFELGILRANITLTCVGSFSPTATPTIKTRVPTTITTNPTPLPTSISPTFKPTSTPTIDSVVITPSPIPANNDNDIDKDKKGRGGSKLPGDLTVNIHNKYIIYGNGNNVLNNNYFDNDITYDDIIQCACFNINDITSSTNKCYIDYMGGKIIRVQRTNTSETYEYMIDYDNKDCKCYKDNTLSIHESSIPDEVFRVCINALNNIHINQCSYSGSIITLKALNDAKYILKGNKGTKFQIMFIFVSIIISIIIFI